jgi:hypothetical protein
MVYNYFVYRMRHRYTIDTQIINEIRNYLTICGWKNDNDMTNLFEVQDLYEFIMNQFSQKKISFIINDGLDSNEIHKTIDVNYIGLKINKNSSIKTLLNDWINTNIGDNKYELKQIPNFIPVFLDRNIFSSQIDNHVVDIEEGIQFELNNLNEEQQNTVWKIHSIVCFSKGRYYSIVRDEHSWYIYNNSKLPSLMNIDLKDKDIAYKIQKECVFILYTLDDK